MSPRAAGIAGVAAAVVASAGDLLLLWVSNARRPELALPAPPAGALLAGTYMGILAIPLYGVGWWQVACGLGLPAGRGARWVLWLGAYTAALGGVLHGLTGLVLHEEVRAGIPGADPLAVIGRYGAFLVPLWGMAVVLSLAGSMLFAGLVLRGGTAYPRWMAATNPAVVVGILGGLAAPSLWLRAFLLPAAPNLGHVVFFGLSTAALWRSGGRGSRR